MSRFDLNEWVRREQGKHLCQCGCGRYILVKRHHHARGVPGYINGHYSRAHNPMRGMCGAMNPNYRGGCYIDSKGYVVVLNPERSSKADKYAYEHRLVMERHLGRRLAPNEQVHHRNGNKTDNRIENLVVLSVSDHAALHDQDLRTRLGNRLYLKAKRRICRGQPYRELMVCSA